jgi:hypothetical protein
MEKTSLKRMRSKELRTREEREQRANLPEKERALW